MIITNDYGVAQFTGVLTTMTSYKQINSNLIYVPSMATHYINYSTGGVAALIDNEKITGGTSNKTARIVKVVRDNGTGGSSDDGLLLLKTVSGTFQSETITGATSGGTAAIVQDLIQIKSAALPKCLLLTVETASVNITFDGTNPTLTAGTNLGHTLTTGQTMTIFNVESMRNMKVINAANASGAIVKYSIYF